MMLSYAPHNSFLHEVYFRWQKLKARRKLKKAFKKKIEVIAELDKDMWKQRNRQKCWSRPGERFLYMVPRYCSFPVNRFFFTDRRFLEPTVSWKDTSHRSTISLFNLEPDKNHTWFNETAKKLSRSLI
jgi:hypothetical protein